jgi:hypothetical protein
MELFAMSVAISHARRLLDENQPEAGRAVELADLFCRGSRRKVQRLFQDLWRNEDQDKNRLAADFMQGEYAWLVEGAVDMELAPEAFQTRLLRQTARYEERMS